MTNASEAIHTTPKPAGKLVIAAIATLIVTAVIVTFSTVWD